MAILGKRYSGSDTRGDARKRCSGSDTQKSKRTFTPAPLVPYITGVAETRTGVFFGDSRPLRGGLFVVIVVPDKGEIAQHPSRSGKHPACYEKGVGHVGVLFTVIADAVDLRVVARFAHVARRDPACVGIRRSGCLSTGLSYLLQGRPPSCL